jgi:pyridoxal 5'-phosphate synthase pdxT subunit
MKCDQASRMRARIKTRIIIAKRAEEFGCEKSKMTIGILAIQGDFEAHARTLDKLGVDHVYVRTPQDLQSVDGLILPGGESTTHMKLLAETGLDEAIHKMVANGGALFGTCAGAILLAREVKSPAQKSLGLLDMTVIRNAYGRQLSSDVVVLPTKLRDEPMEMVFIRAPVIDKTGDSVEILAERNAKPVLVQQGNVIAATFHPELTNDTAIHRRFVELVEKRAGKNMKQE